MVEIVHMRLLPSYLISGFIFLATIGQAHGEVFNCNGVWKSSPCDSTVQSVSALESKPDSRNSEERKKEKVIRDSKKVLWTMQGRYSPTVYSEFSEAIDVCASQSLADCNRSLTASAEIVLKKKEEVDRRAADANRQRQMHAESLALSARMHAERLEQDAQQHREEMQLGQQQLGEMRQQYLVEEKFFRNR